MTKINFARMCVENLIDPGIALENQNIQVALRENDVEKIKSILREEF